MELLIQLKFLKTGIFLADIDFFSNNLSYNYKILLPTLITKFSIHNLISYDEFLKNFKKFKNLSNVLISKKFFTRNSIIKDWKSLFKYFICLKSSKCNLLLKIGAFWTDFESSNYFIKIKIKANEKCRIKISFDKKRENCYQLIQNFIFLLKK